MHRFCLVVLLLVTAAGPARAQRKEAVILFKDGFYLSGKVVEKKDYIFDPASGRSFPVPLAGGLISLDDGVRRMYFIPGQLQEVMEKKEVNHDMIVLKRIANTAQPDMMMPGWQIVSMPPFNAKWERTLRIHYTQPNGTGYFPMVQRIVQANPRFFHIQTLRYDWDLFYLTKEFTAAQVRPLLMDYYAGKKDMKDWDKRKKIAQFMYQAGWLADALREFDSLVEDYPSRKDDVAELRATVKKALADEFVEEIERAFKAGQHKEVEERLGVYARDKLASLVKEKNLLLIQDIKNKYAGLAEKIAQGKKLLTAMLNGVPGAKKKLWTSAVDMIQSELNHDTLAKLDTFIVFAQQHERELADKGTASQAADEVLALAVSGWLLGNAAAEPDVPNALLLLRIRNMVLEYQKTVNAVTRGQLLESTAQSGKMSIDILARVVKNLPPPFAYDLTKVGTGPFKVDIDIADSRGGSYFVQLPPGYNHARPYPVVLVLRGGAEKPEVTMSRLSPLAAQFGFILVAPIPSGAPARYGYTAAEHGIVLDTVRDMRRRFQVDSDRVFLFGYLQGADAAIDIGMAHPDQFAGVLPMCGAPRYFSAERNGYQTNAQYLPFYLVDGDRDGANPKVVRSVFKEWARNGYPSLYVEYKGRGPEWYGAELPRMFDWMARKHRHHPVHEMGRRHTGGWIGEEFRTMRECDNRFYWLSTDAIDPRYLNDPDRWVRSKPPASVQASIAVGNQLATKAGQKVAHIFTQVNIQAKGLRQLSLWLAPSMVDFSKPLRIRVNGSFVGGERMVPPNPAVLLEDFYYNGDRQRLWYARIDMKL